MKVINLFGGPGTGKSTTAAGLFHIMKLQKMECELVTEYAKDLVWAGRFPMLSEQDYIFAKQNHRLRRLIGKVDWVITDSPLILGNFYIKDDFPGRVHFCNFIQDVYASYDNVNIFLRRVKQYNPNGRTQTEEEATEIDKEILKYLISRNMPYTIIDADKDAHTKILEMILSNNV